MNKPSELIKIAQDLVDKTSEFHKIKGPGKGDHATGQFMKALQREVCSIRNM